MPKLFIELFCETHRGRKRDANEDTAFGFPIGTVPASPVETLAVIGAAGGMGGAGAGDAASGAARRFIESVFQNGEGAGFALEHAVSVDDHTKLLGNVFDECNRTILHAAASAHKSGVMGTTLALGVIVYNGHDNKTYLHVGNVGNCRGYIIRGEQIFHATEEDSVAWRLYKKGAITYSELLAHPLRNQITVMGIDTAVSPEVHSIELRAGDVVIFCTDGVHEALDDAAIYAVTRKYPGAKKGCEHLLDAARSASGSKDNAAAAMACCYPVPMAGAKRFPGSADRTASGRAAFRTKAMVAVWSTVCVLAIAAAAVYFRQPAAMWNVKGFFGRPVAAPRTAAAQRTPNGPAQETVLARTAVGDSLRPAADRRSVEPAAEPTVEKNLERIRQEPAPLRVSAARTEAAAAGIRVEWNAETERFRITTSRAETVPTQIRYGAYVFDVVPVKNMPNLYRTTMPLSRSMLSASKVVHVTVADSKNPIAIVFTPIQ